MREEYKELSFYRHRVQITIEGFRTDKLLSTAFRKGIKLRNVRMISDTELIAWVSYRDCKTLRKLAKSLYRITVIKEAGPQTKVSTASDCRNPAGCIHRFFSIRVCRADCGGRL